MKQGQQERTMELHDWDFSAVPHSELAACCYYEYARESPTIRAHYHEGKPIECFPGGLHYNATTDDTLQKLPNPFVWASCRNAEEPFFSRSWQDREPIWRAEIVKAYSAKEIAKGLPPAFMAGDTQFMSARIISRGDRRAGIDTATGRERVVVEIDWAWFTDGEIAEEALKWVKANRPPAIGQHSAQGREKDSGWRAKLDHLAVMRLLRRATLKELPTKFHQAWKMYGPKGSHQLYKMRKAARSDLHQLFPFLPTEEVPFSWPTAGGREI